RTLPGSVDLTALWDPSLALTQKGHPCNLNGVVRPFCVSVSPTHLSAIEHRNLLSRDLRTVDTPPAAPQPACKHKKRRLHPVRTYSPKPGEIQRDWYVVDATDVVLGRLAAQIATLLRG